MTPNGCLINGEGALSQIKTFLLKTWRQPLYPVIAKIISGVLDKMSGRPLALCRTFWACVRHFPQLMTGKYQWSIFQRHWTFDMVPKCPRSFNQESRHTNGRMLPNALPPCFSILPGKLKVYYIHHGILSQETSNSDEYLSPVVLNQRHPGHYQLAHDVMLQTKQNVCLQLKNEVKKVLMSYYLMGSRVTECNLYVFGTP